MRWIAPCYLIDLSKLSSFENFVYCWFGRLSDKLNQANRAQGLGRNSLGLGWICFTEYWTSTLYGCQNIICTFKYVEYCNTKIANRLKRRYWRACTLSYCTIEPNISWFQLILVTIELLMCDWLKNPAILEPAIGACCSLVAWFVFTPSGDKFLIEWTHFNSLYLVDLCIFMLF